MTLPPNAAQESTNIERKSQKFRVLSTDPDWIEVLRSQNLQNEVNFWRKDRRKVHLPEGSHLYFWLRGSRSVAGRAVFRRQLDMSTREAWDTFGIANGVTSYEALTHKVIAVLRVDDDNINCLVCGEVQILDPVKYPQLPEDFRATQNPKDYSEGDLPQIESVFPSVTVIGLFDIEAQLRKDGLFDPDTVETARETFLRAIVIRRGQSEFRKLLMHGYDMKCAVTGTADSAVLEAAHIYPYKGKETNVLQNGILLRADWHTLFDLGLWTLDEGFQIILAPEITSEEYRKHHQTPIRLPEIVSHHPSLKAIEWHRSKVFCQFKI